MSETQENAQPVVELSNKELNFRKQEEYFKQQLERERNARIEAEKRAEEALQRSQRNNSLEENDDDDDDEPYITKQKYNKKLKAFKQETQQEVLKTKESISNETYQRIRDELWVEQHPDFYDTLKEHANKIYQADPDLANAILQMPDNFARQKLVYKNIKALGLDKPAKQEPTIQDKINANRKSPYYQPSGVGTSPYGHTGDFSASGQKNAYDKMVELKNRLRLS